MNIEPEENDLYNQIKNDGQNQELQNTTVSDIISNEQGGVEDGQIYNQGRVYGSVEETDYTGRKNQTTKNSATVDEYVTGGKGEILSGSTGKTQRRIRINHTKNSSVAFTEGTEDGTDGYKAYTAFVNAGIKAIYCQGSIERTVNGITVARTESFTAPDGTVYVSSESSLPPKQTFDHEIIHIADKTNNPAYSDYESVLYENADYSSNTYIKLAEKLNEIYFDNKYDIDDIDSYPIFMREIAAYINQFALSDPEFAESTFGGMFSDWGAVVEAVNKFNTDMEADFSGSANFMPGGETDNTVVGRRDGDIADFNGIDTVKSKHLNKAQQDEIFQIGKELGRKVIFEDFYLLDKFKGKKRMPDGYIDSNGEVHINYYAKRPVYFLFKHEITHYLKRALASYNDFMNLVIESNAFQNWLNKKGYSSIDTLKTEIMNTYSEVKGFDESQCYDEILADFVGEYLFGGENAVSEKLINALEPPKRKTFKDVIKDIINYFKEKFQKNKSIQSEIQKIENEFIKVYNQAVEQKNTAESGVRYSIVALDNGNTYVKASRNVIKGDDISEWRKQITNFFNELLEGEKSLDINTIDGDVLTITKSETANKARDNYKYENGKKVRMSADEFRVKLNAEAHIDEIVETSIDDVNKTSDTKSHGFAKDGFTYRTAYFQDFDGEYYKIKLSVGYNGTVATVYNVGKINKDSLPSHTKIVAVVGSKPLGKLSNGSIRNTDEKVNNNLSKNGEEYSVPTLTNFEELLEKYENGEISRTEYLDALRKDKTLNPAEIANLTEEDANTTPKLNKKAGKNNGDGKSKFYESLMGSDIFDQRFKDEAEDDSFIEKYKTVG